VTDRRRGILLIAIAALLWSTGGIGIKAIADAPLKVTFYRSVFAAITLVLFFRKRVFARRWRSSAAFAIAIVSYGTCLTTFVVATKWTTAANAIFLQYAGVVWVLIFSPLVVREPMRTRDVIAIAVAISGMALFFVGRFEARGMAGNAMALISSVFFAALILALRREHDAAESAITWGNAALALALLPAVAHDLPLTMKSFAVLLFLGVFQIALAYVLFVRGLKYVTATQASLTGMLEPVSNPIWVLLFLGERPSGYAIAGAIIVLAAIAWHTLGGEPATDLPAPD
jgi:drug/metabolite transporter (DMT)-like permease